VLLVHLHAARRYTPLACIEVNLAPFGLPQLAGPYEEQRREP